MKPIPLDKFKDYLKYDKRVGLRLIYRDFNVKNVDDKVVCRNAWDVLEKKK